MSNEKEGGSWSTTEEGTVFAEDFWNEDGGWTRHYEDWKGCALAYCRSLMEELDTAKPAWHEVIAELLDGYDVLVWIIPQAANMREQMHALLVQVHEIAGALTTKEEIKDCVRVDMREKNQWTQTWYMNHAKVGIREQFAMRCATWAMNAVLLNATNVKWDDFCHKRPRLVDCSYCWVWGVWKYPVLMNKAAFQESMRTFNCRSHGVKRWYFNMNGTVCGSWFIRKTSKSYGWLSVWGGCRGRWVSRKVEAAAALALLERDLVFEFMSIGVSCWLRRSE